MKAKFTHIERLIQLHQIASPNEYGHIQMGLVDEDRNIVVKALCLLELIESGDYVVVPKEMTMEQLKATENYEHPTSIYKWAVHKAQQDEKIRSILDD